MVCPLLPSYYLAQGDFIFSGDRVMLGGSEQHYNLKSTGRSERQYNLKSNTGNSYSK